MFRELVPYLRHRAVLFTVTDLGEDQIRVNVVPQKLKDGENEALTTPLSVTGTAEELDAELPKTLVDYVAAHLQLRNTLESAKAQMDAAAKAAHDEAKAKTKSAGKGTTKPLSNGQPLSESVKPAAVVQPSQPAAPSLFDFAGTTHPSGAIAAATPVATEEEILSEVDEADEENADDLADTTQVL